MGEFNRKIGIIISTTRPKRFADTIATWFKGIADQRGDAAYEIVDLRDYPLPFFEEEKSPLHAMPANEIARRWSAKMAELDGYVFITAEYNHSIPAVLKNALDYAYREYNRKPAAFVGYGGAGAARAVEHLRGILAELQVATLKFVVQVNLAEFLALRSGEKSFDDFPYLRTSATAMLDDLAWWSSALRIARTH